MNKELGEHQDFARRLRAALHARARVGPDDGGRPPLEAAFPTPMEPGGRSSPARRTQRPVKTPAIGARELACRWLAAPFALIVAFLSLRPSNAANVLAAEIGLDLDPASIALTLATGEARRVALGRANGRRFILMAGAGFDAHVVDEVSVPLKRRLGKGAYVLATLDQLLRFDFKPYRVRIDGSTYDAASVVVANGRYYAGRYLCAPAASLAEPSLEVCLFERGGRLSTVGYALALLAGRLPGLSSYRIIRTGSLEIEGRSGEPVQGDGDVLTRLNVTMDVVPNALDLIFPPGPARIR